MAENSNGNGVYVDEEEEEEEIKLKQKKQRLKETLPEVLNRIASAILFQEPADAGSLLRRIKVSVADNATLLPEASRNSARDVLIWTRRGTPFRALFVISVGTVTFVALTGLLVFMLFFLAATVNAIVISLLMSLAAAGGFLALFFAFVTAIYIGALSIAIFAISVTTFWAIVAILMITGNKLFGHLILFSFLFHALCFRFDFVCYYIVIKTFISCVKFNSLRTAIDIYLFHKMCL
ncbi:hypothetical protein AAZX31_18G043100 [Glycine max]